MKNKLTFKTFLLTVFVVGAMGAMNTSAFAQNEKPDVNKPILASAIFAGGCFWCVESDYEKLKGVIEGISGYSGGKFENPTYGQVSSKLTDQYEVAKIIYDPTVITYKELVDYFWTHIDPTDEHGQFCDKGSPYKSAIFWANEEEKAIAEKSLQDLTASKKFDKYGGIKTKVIKATKFWPAEDYHQDYYKKNPVRYNFYRLSCGRDNRVKELWGKSQ